MKSKMVNNTEIRRKSSKNLLDTLWKYKYLYALLILPISYFMIFKYIPMLGNVIAFRTYIPSKSIFGEGWVGLKYFR